MAWKAHRSNLLIESSDLIVCYFRLFRQVAESLVEIGASCAPVGRGTEVLAKKSSAPSETLTKKRDMFFRPTNSILMFKSSDFKGKGKKKKKRPW